MSEQIDREMELAWLSHDPLRRLIPGDVLRRLRALKRELEPTANLIERLLRDDALVKNIITPLVRCRGVHRQRMLSDLKRALPAAELRIAHREILEIAWLSPKYRPIIIGGAAGEQQNCILCCFALAYQPLPGIALSLHASWALEITDHAAARLLQRSPAADFRDAVLEAALAFAAADAAAIKPLVGTGASIYLPAGPGAFTGSVIGGRTADGGKSFIYARCRTFLPASWMRPDQVPLPRAKDAKSTVALALWRWDDGGSKPPLGSVSAGRLANSR
jgi:hypothetical protein